MPTYHFHAICQKELGSISNIDGLLVRKDLIETGDDYTKIKEQIGKEFGLDHTKLVICSLSLLTPNTEVSRGAEEAQVSAGGSPSARPAG